MKFIYNPASPFVRKVWVTMLETGQDKDFDFVQVTTTAVNTAQELKVVNPLGKIPAIGLDDGSAIYDSRVICRYLDDRVKAGLYQTESPWRLLTLEATADGIMEACVLMVYEARIRPEDMRYAPWVEGQWAKAQSAIKVINDRFMDILSGPFSMGHIAVACALGYVDFRHADRNWRRDAPELAEWYETALKRDAMQATLPG